MCEDSVKNRMFPLPSVELDLEESGERGKKKKNPQIRQAAFSSPAVQAGKAQCDK